VSETARRIVSLLIALLFILSMTVSALLVILGE
jgi:hypothetical protein